MGSKDGGDVALRSRFYLLGVGAFLLAIGVLASQP